MTKVIAQKGHLKMSVIIWKKCKVGWSSSQGKCFMILKFWVWTFLASVLCPWAKHIIHYFFTRPSWKTFIKPAMLHGHVQGVLKMCEHTMGLRQKCCNQPVLGDFVTDFSIQYHDSMVSWRCQHIKIFHFWWGMNFYCQWLKKFHQFKQF